MTAIGSQPADETDRAAAALPQPAAAYLRALVDSMPQLAWQLDRQGRTQFVNRRWTDYTGLTLEGSTAAERTALQHPDDIPRAVEARQRSLASGEPYDLEHRIRDRGGKYRWFRSRNVTAVDESGEIIGWVGTATDIDDDRRATERLELLAESGATLGSSLDYEVTLTQLAGLVTRGFADSCSIDLLDEATGMLRRVTTRHRDPALADVAEAFRHLPPIDPEDPKSVGVVLKSRKPLLFRHISDRRRSAVARGPEQQQLLERVGSHSGIVVAMEVRDTAVGVLTLGREGDSPEFDENDLSAAQELARRGGIAIDHTRLYRLSNEALSHQRFLAQLGQTLATSLDLGETLDRITALLVPDLADYCILESFDAEGKPTRLAGRHGDPGLQETFARLMRYPAQLDRLDPRARVMHTGEPFAFESMDRGLMRAYARDPEHLDVIERLRPGSGVLIPLAARGQSLGVLTLMRTAGSEPFAGRTLSLAREAAARAALAIDNARLFSEATERAAELERANAAKDDFLGLVSHELRTPLTTIHGNADALRRHEDRLAPADRLAALEDIARDAERLQRLVENMLTLSRLERSETPRLEPVLVQRILPRILDAHRRRNPGRTMEVDLGELPPVLAQPTYLEQVFDNLLSNAEKYSGPELPLSITADDKGAFVRVRVRDYGPGVSADELPQLATPFFRSARTAGRVPGAGLGLAVCKLLVEAQGGELDVSLPEGGGLEFSFTLPIAEDEEPL